MTYEQAKKAMLKQMVVYRPDDMEGEGNHIKSINYHETPDSKIFYATLSDGGNVEVNSLSFLPSGQLTYRDKDDKGRHGSTQIELLYGTDKPTQEDLHNSAKALIQNSVYPIKNKTNMEQQKSSYTAEQFAIMNRLDGKTVKDTITGFTGKVTGFAVYPEYEGKYVNVMIGKQTTAGDFVERWIWNTRLEVID